MRTCRSPRSTGAGEGRQHWCRECFRGYFRERGDLHRAQAHGATEARRQPIRERLLGEVRVRGCADCGVRDPRVLEFDHVGAKSASIAGLLNRGASIDEVEAELASCDVVCANCHRQRTARRGGWRRLLDGTPDHVSGRQARRLRNIRYVYARLRNAACADCGESDSLLLEHDHVGTKRAGVMKLAWNDYSIVAIEAEIAQCEVRCCNCHRRRTAEAAGWFRSSAVRATLAGPP